LNRRTDRSQGDLPRDPEALAAAGAAPPGPLPRSPKPADEGGTVPEEARRARLLVELLDDDSPAVMSALRTAIARQAGVGERVIRRELERALDDDRPRLRARARLAVNDLDRRAVIRRLLGIAARGRVDLESALFVLCRLDRANFDARPYRKALDAMAAEVSRRIIGEEDPLRRSMALVSYLGNDLRYTGAEAEYYHPQHAYLHRVIETRRGLPLTISALYLFVARRCGIPAGLLPLPGRVLLRLEAGQRPLIVDPFHSGAVRSRAYVVRYLSEHELTPRPEWFREADDALIFQRQALNLMHSEQLGGRMTAAEALYRVAETVQVGRKHLLRSAAGQL
jgi:regulator of sirC expression with transglutaminase-like and TPR domain